MFVNNNISCFLHFYKAVGLEGDVRKQDDAKRVVESTFQHFGRLDILVNAAAGNFLVPSEDLSPNGFRTGLMLQHSILHMSIGQMIASFIC